MNITQPQYLRALVSKVLKIAILTAFFCSTAVSHLCESIIEGFAGLGRSSLYGILECPQAIVFLYFLVVFVYLFTLPFHPRIAMTQRLEIAC